MTRPADVREVALIGDYVPRQCGIATFTHDLRHALSSEFPSTRLSVVAVNDIPEGYEYSPEVRFEIPEQDPDAYQRAAEFLSFSNADVVNLQHEFGIYGGPTGRNVLILLRNLLIPVVSTLHTVLAEPDQEQLRITEELIALSSRVVVMSEQAKALLQKVYDSPDSIIDVIPHGIPDVPFVDPNFYKDQFGVEGKYVALTFGLLSPAKGIENVLKAIPTIVERFPDFVYVVLGATHPRVLREEGEGYRRRLERVARELHIEEHVIFHNRFVEAEELKEFIGAADLYVTPYVNREQAVSGTLAYCLGSGKAVVSTPYRYAEELLAEERGVLTPFGDPAGLAEAIIGLLDDEAYRHSIRKRAYAFGREMTWSQVAHRYMESFVRARQQGSRALGGRRHMRPLSRRARELPRLRLDHLFDLTDSTGILQHASHTIPRPEHGYCTDDTARALILTVMLERLGIDDREVTHLSSVYARFLEYALEAESRRFRNFLSYDRRWLEEVGSDDCHGRALWALGACVGQPNRPYLQNWAAELFERALPPVVATTSPRAWAFTLIGIHEYLRRFSGDRLANQVRTELTTKLLERHGAAARDGWDWFEDELTYCNAKLPHALILSGQWTPDQEALDLGLRTLRWLTGIQQSASGHFRAIGAPGSYRRGSPVVESDQQPIEAYSTLSACLEAYRATRDQEWVTIARKAFDWFLGGNDLGLELYDPRTGGCRDGLQADRINRNQGAESTLAFLLSLAEIRLFEGGAGLESILAP